MAEGESRRIDRSQIMKIPGHHTKDGGQRKAVTRSRVCLSKTALEAPRWIAGGRDEGRENRLEGKRQ